MRICMVVHAHYPIGETRVEREAHALIDLGHQVDVICLLYKGEPVYEVVNGVSVYRIPVRRKLGRQVIAQLWEYISFFFMATLKVIVLNNRHRYDVIQAHNPPDWLVFVGLVPKLTGARLVLDLHDLMPEFFASRYHRSMKSFPARFLMLQERISCRYANHVITVTDAWRENLIKRKLTRSKVSVVMNVPDDRIFFHCEQKERSISSNGHLLLFYHGNVTYRYGLDLVISAIEILKEKIPGIHLHIHGIGDAHKYLIEYTKKLGLENHVTFTTRGILTSDLPDLIRKADICLVPYRSDVFTDGILPTKLMEYAALGMPAIAARTSAIQSYFNDANVEFFEPGNVDDLVRCILMLYHNPDRLVELSLKSQNFNLRYNWKHIGAEYGSLVESLGGVEPRINGRNQ